MPIRGIAEFVFGNRVRLLVFAALCPASTGARSVLVDADVVEAAAVEAVAPTGAVLAAASTSCSSVNAVS